MLKRLLLTVAILVLAQTTFAQFGNQSYSNKLVDLAERLSREASDFAASNYSSYSNSFRSNRTEVEAVMLTEQFGGASRIFYRMVVDRRRNQDLRDAFSLLQELARNVERNNLQKNTWNNIQRLMSDVGREIDAGGNDNSGGYPAQGGRGGRISWKGRVDDDIRITFRGGSADIETIGGTPYNDAQPNFMSSLPSRRVNVTLNVRKGRGQVFLEQQPSRDNDYAVIVRVKDPKGGASDYEFELSW